MTETMTGRASELMRLGREHAAHNYHPLPVVIDEAEGAWVTDVEGRRYLDMLAAYSALNFGHRHPRLIAAAMAQLERLTLTSRAFDHDQFGPFCAELAELADMDVVLPMNTGAEAVETAIKVARKWGYTVKGVPADQAVIIAFGGNFHGRTTTIVSFSDDEDARADFGPYTPGFRVLPYGDLDALAAAIGEIGDRMVAVLVEPIQGESGVIVPPPGFLAGIRELCTAHGILMIADEIQSGLGRTGYTFACAAEDVTPDAYLLGKALGGGIVPVSAMVSTWPVLGVLRPGQHGSTFGGNPLACAVGREVVAMLRSGEYQARAAVLGQRMHARLAALPRDVVREVRGRGLWAGVEFASLPGREVCERLAARGVLAKETHGHTIRLAPPLVIGEDDLDWGLNRIEDALRLRPGTYGRALTAGRSRPGICGQRLRSGARGGLRRVAKAAVGARVVDKRAA
jgi:ornithine--oxo-acid transaminase